MAHPLTTRPDPSEYAQSAAEYVSRVPEGNVLDILERQIEETAALVRGLAPGMENKRYAPEKWTIRQIIGHLGDGERVFSQRAFRFSRCDPTPLPGFDENEYVREAPFPRIPIEDLLSELVHLRHATLYLYRSLDEKALMRRGIANGIETSVRAIAFIIAGHEHHHLEVLRTRYLAMSRHPISELLNASMNRRSFLQKATITAAGFGVLRNVQACATAPVIPSTPLPATFAALRDLYFVFQLKHDPVTSTYLGGDGYSPELADSNGRLRDYRPQSLEAEIRFYRDVKAALNRMVPATPAPGAKAPSSAVAPTPLTPIELIDYRLMNAQLGFLIHQLADLRYFQRSLDTYVQEPFRGVDWQIQQMPDLGGGLLGNDDDWQLVVTRTQAIPAYLEVAKANLLAGKTAGNIPDKRMVQRDGIAGSKANADYFRNTLANTARPFLGARPFAQPMTAQLISVGATAATAWDAFAEFLSQTFDVNEAVDRFAAGEAEYEWRVHNALADPRRAAELYEYGAAQVALYTAKMVDVAREFAAEAKMGLSFNTDAEKNVGVRRVMDFLSKDSPKNDEQLFKWYRDAGERAVAYGREFKLFDIPAEYHLEVVPTPPVLRSALDAAYYPAPPFKKSGKGRFYLTPTGNDPAALKLNNFSSVADTAVHEGFPGHDWHYRYMNEHADQISNIRWLTPGAVEDSSSMWTDSMAAEGWGLYSEELMAEPKPNHKYGFYSAGEYLYELQGQLLRAVRIRVDVGLHTGRMTFDQAIDYFTEHVSFYPNARINAAVDPTARAIADGALRAIYRYSKWPTQAITYNLGKNAIIELREACKAATGPTFSAKTFHERFMGMGTVPVAYFKDSFLAACTPAA